MIQSMAGNQDLMAALEASTKAVIEALSLERKIWFCGNGGSAADAQHLAAEFTGRFYFHRKALNAEALHCNTSYLTAVANDYSYDDVYARMIEGLAKEGDVLIAFSTSGNSANIIKAIEAALQLKLCVIGFTGMTGGKMKGVCSHLINIPSEDTPRIQEGHMLLGHLLCEQVEKALFPR